jgi:hypothetical protein
MVQNEYIRMHMSGLYCEEQEVDGETVFFLSLSLSAAKLHAVDLLFFFFAFSLPYMPIWCVCVCVNTFIHFKVETLLSN